MNNTLESFMSKVIPFDEFKNFNRLNVESTSPTESAAPDMHHMYFEEAVQILEGVPPLVTGNVREDIHNIVADLLAFFVHYSIDGAITPEFTAVGKALYGFADQIEGKKSEHRQFLEKIVQL